MKNIQIVSKLGKKFILSCICLVSFFAVNAYAEYYVVASAPCGGGCCYSNCAPHYVKKVYKKVYRPKKHHCYQRVYRPVRSCAYVGCGNYYRSTCTPHCARPAYPSAWVRGHWNCYGEWVPGHWRNYYYQTNYGYPSMVYDPDLTTGDDNPMIDPDMNIDR